MITEFQGKYRWLSNFWPVSVMYEGIMYPSVENAYQAAKTRVVTTRLQFQYCTASQAKQLGKRSVMRKDWDQIKLSVMTDLCTQKYNQEPFRTQLLETSDQLLQEGNKWGDTFWGVYNGKGQNHLGQIIMAIRAGLAKEPVMDIKEMNWVAIIGSREPTEKQIEHVKWAILCLDPKTQAIISGCAYGIDALALEEGQKRGMETIGIVPWTSYNTDVQKYCSMVQCIDDFNEPHRKEAYDSVAQFHPAVDRLSQGAMKLHARNYGIIRWASEVIAAPSSKPGGGGTGQGIRLAEHLNIPLVIIKP